MARKRYKGAINDPGGFVAVPNHFLRSQEFAGLSAAAVKLLMDLLSQYRGNNNGDLCAAWTVMEKRGWRSRDTLGKALSELQCKRFIVKTRQGGRHCPSLYAVTFRDIDPCNDRLDDRGMAGREHLGAWQAQLRTVRMKGEISISLTQSAGQFNSDWPAERVTTFDSQMY
jgi:hypothetical protein